MKPALDLDDICAVVFDLDGTLYQKSGLPFRLIMADLPHMLMLGNERKARKTLMGQWFGSEVEYYKVLYERVAEMSHSTPERVERWYNQGYMPDMLCVLRRHYHIEPWVEPLMTELREKGIRTAVYSDYGCLRERLEALHFNPSWVDVVADAPSLGGLKPCRQSALALCEMIGVDPKQTLMVGDRDDTDGETARRCGMKFHLITSL